MTQTLPKLVTFEEFAAWRPEGGRYELRDGVIVEWLISIMHTRGAVDALKTRSARDLLNESMN